MISQTGILALAALLSFCAVAFSLVCFRSYRLHRELLEFLAKQNEDLEKSLAASRNMLETYSTRGADQSRRLAWLETRVRQPKTAPEEMLDEETLNSPAAAKSTITERRHRVLTLASRGQDAGNIAATLGMLRGEVELIINLNRVNIN